MRNILSIADKFKVGPSMTLVEGAIPIYVFNNITYQGFIVKYEN